MGGRNPEQALARLLLDQPGIAHRLFLRLSFLVAGATAAMVAGGFTLRVPAMVDLWPWADTPLSFAFLGAVMAALAGGSLWIGLSGDWRSAVPSLFGLLLISAASAGYLWWLDQDDGVGDLEVQIAVMAAGASFALIMLFLAKGGDPNLSRMAPLARFSCLFYGLALGFVGYALIERWDTVFPWALQPETSTVFGIVFAGLAVIYLLTAWNGERGGGIVVMLGFLVYDALLLPRLLPLVSSITPELLPSLIAYVVVLIYSAAVAVDFLFLGGRRATQADGIDA
ncbi:MAG: hypothetical protein AB7I79_08875 [Rhizobiaceae bacterium]